MGLALISLLLVATAWQPELDVTGCTPRECNARRPALAARFTDELQRLGVDTAPKQTRLTQKNGLVIAELRQPPTVKLKVSLASPLECTVTALDSIDDSPKLSVVWSQSLTGDDCIERAAQAFAKSR